MRDERMDTETRRRADTGMFIVIKQFFLTDLIFRVGHWAFRPRPRVPLVSSSALFIPHPSAFILAFGCVAQTERASVS